MDADLRRHDGAVGGIPGRQYRASDGKERGRRKRQISWLAAVSACRITGDGA
jgi:hypothetical protein